MNGWHNGAALHNQVGRTKNTPCSLLGVAGIPSQLKCPILALRCHACLPQQTSQTAHAKVHASFGAYAQQARPLACHCTQAQGQPRPTSHKHCLRSALSRRTRSQGGPVEELQRRVPSPLQARSLLGLYRLTRRHRQCQCRCQTGCWRHHCQWWRRAVPDRLLDSGLCRCLPLIASASCHL